MSDTTRTLLDPHQLTQLVAAILTAGTLSPSATTGQAAERYGEMLLRLQKEARPAQG